jgi:transposase-like protein
VRFIHKLNCPIDAGLRALEATKTYFSIKATLMNAVPILHCPNGCNAVGDDFKLVRCYGPNRTTLYRCRKCSREFSSRYNSVFFGFHTDEQTIYRVLKALAEGNGIRACSRIFDIDKNTVIRILSVAGVHCQQVTEQLIGNYHLKECQLDELWSFVKKRKHVFRRLKN